MSSTSISSRLEFNPSAFLKSLKNIHFPDRKTPVGHALKYIYMEQITSDEALLVCYIGEGWFSIRLPCVGFIGSCYLFEGQDALDRLTKSLSVIKDSRALQFFQTPNSRMSVLFVLPNSKSKSNILINTYNGDYSDFTSPWVSSSSLPLSTLTSIPKPSIKYFTSALRIANSFSSLSSDTFEKPVWLWSINSSLWLVCTEKSGTQGVSLLCIKLYDSTFLNFDVGVMGKQLLKAAYLFFEFNDTNLSLNSENQFVITSQDSMAILKTFNPNFYQPVTSGFKRFFLNRPTSNYICHLTFFLEELINITTLSTPRTDSLSTDIVLELSENNSVLTISKRSDPTKQEKSETPILSESNASRWKSIVLPHPYFLQALLCLKTNYLRQEKEEQEDTSADFPSSFDDFEDVDDPSPSPSPSHSSLPKEVTLTLDSFGQFFVLYISPSPFNHPLQEVDYCVTINCRPLQPELIDDY